MTTGRESGRSESTEDEIFLTQFHEDEDPDEEDSIDGAEGNAEHDEALRAQLEILDSEATELVDYHTNLQFRILTNLLIVIRGLPAFYFYEEAHNAGVPADVYKHWRPSEWAKRPVAGRRMRLAILQTLMKVQLRLWDYPESETYWESHKIMLAKFEELDSKKFSHNKLSQYLGYSFRTLANIKRKREGGAYQPKHCPWQIRRRLEGAEDEIDRSPHYQVQRPNPTPESRVAQEISEMELEVERTLREQVIELRGNCWQCGYEWSNLRFIGISENLPLHHEYQCRPCSRTNYTAFPIIERYSTCAHCGSPWPNLQALEIDEGNYQTRRCEKCDRENRVKPPRMGANITRRGDQG